MSSPERQALADMLQAIDDVSIGMSEAKEMMHPLPDSVQQMADRTMPQRIASRALLKSVEQLQDLIARALRMILILEEEDLTGLSARAIADRAESIGLIGSSDRWSALVKLRNQLVHEYPLPKNQQLARLQDAWAACGALLAHTATITSFLRESGYLDEDDD